MRSYQNQAGQLSDRGLRRLRRGGLAVSAATALAGLHVHSALGVGASFTWNNAGTSFNSGADWNNAGTTGTVPGTYDLAYFSGTATYAPVLNSPTTISAIQFSSTGGTELMGTATLTLSELGLTPSTSSGSSYRLDSGAGTIDTPIVLAQASGTVNFTSYSGGVTTLNGPISLNNGALATGFSGGTFVLNGSNSFSGGLTIGGAAATIIGVGNVLALNATATTSAPITAANKMTLTTSLTLTGANKLNNAITFTSASAGALVLSGSGAFEFGGNIALANLNRNISGAVSGGATFDGVLGGDNGNGITFDPTSSVFTLAGNNTYTGATAIYGTGVVSIASFGDTSNPGNLGNSLSAINIGSTTTGGALRYTGPTFSTLRTINLVGTTGGGTIDTTGAAGSLTISASSFNITGNGNKTLTLGGDTLNDTFAALIADSSGGGSTSLTKIGAGSWVLTNTNTYTGLTSVNTGTLALGSGASINSGNAVTVGATGTLDIGGNSQTLGLLSNAGLVTNSGSAATLTIGNGSTGAGSFTGSALSVVWNQGATSSTMTGAAGFTNTGSLTFNANGAGNIGVTEVNNTGPVTNSGSGTGATTLTTVTSNVTTVTENSATSGLTLGGSANGFPSLLVVQGTVTGGAAAATFGAGTITLGSASSSNNATLVTTSSLTYVNPLYVASGDSGALTLSGSSGNPTFSGGVTFGASASTLTLAYSGSAIPTISTGNITGTGNLVITSAGTASHVTLSVPSINMVGSITNNGTGTGSTSITSPIGSNVTSVNETGASPLVLSGSNSFTGGVFVSAGQLSVNGAYALSTGPLVIDGGALGTSGVTLTPVVAETWNADFAFSPSNVAYTLNMGAGAVNLGTTTFGTPAVAGARTLTFSNGGTLVINGIVGNGAGAAAGVTGLIKAGSGGTLNLANAANSFSNLTINGGAVFTSQTTVAGSFAAPGDLGTPFGTATITLNGGTLSMVLATVGSSQSFTTLDNSIALSSASTIIPGGGAYKDLIMPGLITGTGPLTLSLGQSTASNASAGVFLAHANNTYSGGTAINVTSNASPLTGSVLFVAEGANALGGGSGGAGGVVTFENAGNITSQNPGYLVVEADQSIAGLNSVTAVNGLGATYVTGYSATTPTLTINNTAGGTGDGSVYTGAIGGTPSAVGNIISADGNNLALVKTGTGTQVLTGVNTFTGSVSINGGTLTIDATNSASAALAGTSTISIAGGATLKLLNSGATSGTSMINDSAVISLSDASGNPTVELDLGTAINPQTETVFGLLFDNGGQPAGLYSAMGVPAGSSIPKTDFTGVGVLDVTSVAPEPSSLGLLAIGSLTLMRRRRKHALSAGTAAGK